LGTRWHDQIDFNGVEQFIFLGKQGFLHSGELLDEMVQAFAHGIPLDGHHV